MPESRFQFSLQGVLLSILVLCVVLAGIRIAPNLSIIWVSLCIMILSAYDLRRSSFAGAYWRVWLNYLVLVIIIVVNLSVWFHRLLTAG